MPNLARIILAAPMSGSGKTTITAGIIAALVARGLKIAPFKCGPDYVDPSYHTLAADRPCTNLDAWLTPPQYISAHLIARAADADMALIEGVMGLFDGYAGEDDSGSTAHIARLTDSPIIIILDVRGMARTAAALVAGLCAFDPYVNIAGVILNRVGSVRHAQMVTQAIEHTVNIPVLGYLVRDTTLSLPERHLGLIPTAEDGEWHKWLERVRTQIEATVDLDHLCAIAASASSLAIAESSTPFLPSSNAALPTIAVARDAAFSFRYDDNLDLLRAAGAKIAFFSPMYDATLPESTQAIYLCGGFPELYADALSDNQTMLASLRMAASNGLPIYAECGGLIYLTEAVVNAEGQRFPLLGLLPGFAVMTPRVTLGYRVVQACADSWLWNAGESVRGHEFHYSVWERESDDHCWLYEIQPNAQHTQTRLEGVQRGNVLASYIHLHFLSMPSLAIRFVAAARTALPITLQP